MNVPTDIHALEERERWIASTALRYRISFGLANHLADISVCESCGDRVPELVVDHNHKTNVVRGRICRSCNARFTEHVTADYFSKQATHWINLANYLRRSEARQWRINRLLVPDLPPPEKAACTTFRELPCGLCQTPIAAGSVVWLNIDTPGDVFRVDVSPRISFQYVCHPVCWMEAFSDLEGGLWSRVDLDEGVPW